MSSFYDLASLIMIPSGKKAGKVYSQKPLTTDGQLDFTRASTATRIGSDGKIEKTRTNLLLQSNSFDTTWSKTRSSVVSGQSGYDGTNNAWGFVDTTDNNTHLMVQSFGYGPSISTFSIYAKAGAVNFLAIRFEGNTGVDYGYFNLSNGTVATFDVDYVTATITSIGNGWYRCTATKVLPNIPDNQIVLLSAESDNDPTYAGAGTTALYLQNAQVEKGLVATNYIETTTASVSVGSVDNMPRLNYTFNSATSCPSLLLEPQRTNLETKSEYFEGWSLVSNVTRTTNYATSPEGTQNASRLQFTANGFLGNTTLSSGTEYTLSCYAKRNDSGSQSFGFFKDGSGAVNSEMTLTSDWKRFTYTYTAGNSSFAGLAASSGADVSVFGYQIEAASYESSYIPTSGATVTRVADAANNLGSAATFNDSEGVFFANLATFLDEGLIADKWIAISDGTSNNSVRIAFSGGANTIRA